MVEVLEVKSKKQQKEFLKFPLELYKNNPCFVPPLWMDEKQIFQKDYVYNDTCESVYYNAYIDGRIVGRISGIIQNAANLKNNEKRVRFTRFDCIEDFEVAKALFEAVEKWAVEHGMDTACGPLGFSDLEREGLLIEGFDQLSTFEEQYNAPYYQDYIEKLGYVKEVDWTECKITAPTDEEYENMCKMSDFVMRRYKLKFAPARNINDWIRKYADQFFDILDKSYDLLYGTVPFTDNMKKTMITNFKLIIKMKYVVALQDENDKVVCVGLCFPSLAKAVQKSQGKLTPAGLCRILHAINHPEIIDLALIGVEPEWLNRGVSAVLCKGIADIVKQPGIKFAETNLNLEDNAAIQNMWKRFGHEYHKKRRSYVKELK